MKQDLSVIKIGGNILDDPQRLDAFLRNFAGLQGQKILIHGGGKIATAIGEKLGIESRYEQGRRITDEATLELVTMVYGGLVSKQLVAKLQALSCNAIGLSGADANVVRANRRPVKTVDFGFVGDVPHDGVSARPLEALMDAGLIPVVAPLTHDGQGNMLNTNADTIAQEIAKALVPGRTVRLIYCFEKPGVLRDAEDDASFIPTITKREFEALVGTGIISGGMIPKLQNALGAIESGVARVVIGQAESLAALVAGTKGTQIQ
jgi:acetylglutamate kinase